MRFAFWSGEEDGLIGSSFYVSQLTQARDPGHRPQPQLRHGRLAERGQLRLRRRRRRARRLRPERVGRDRGRLHRLLHRAGRRSASRRTSTAAATTSASSKRASRRAGCSPAPRASRRRRQAQTYGGTAGAAYDPCYHQACDDIANLDEHTLDLMADAIAHATLTFAETTSAVNGTARARQSARSSWSSRATAHSADHRNGRVGALVPALLRARIATRSPRASVQSPALG